MAFQTPPGSQASSRGQAKDAALLSSCNADLLEPTEWPQGSQASSSVWREDSICALGKAGKEGPHLARTGASQGFPRAAAPVGVFSRGKTRISGSLSCGAGKSGLCAHGEGERVMALQSWERTRADPRYVVRLHPASGSMEVGFPDDSWEIK